VLAHVSASMDYDCACDALAEPATSTAPPPSSRYESVRPSDAGAGIQSSTRLQGIVNAHFRGEIGMVIAEDPVAHFRCSRS
jgi:hypothetical protein